MNVLELEKTQAYVARAMLEAGVKISCMSAEQLHQLCSLLEDYRGHMPAHAADITQSIIRAWDQSLAVAELPAAQRKAAWEALHTGDKGEGTSDDALLRVVEYLLQRIVEGK